MIRWNNKWEEAIKAIQDEHKYLEDRIENLIKENKKLKDEHYKDEELAEMKVKYESMKEDYYRGFAISKEEAEKIFEWEKQHIEKYHSAALKNPGYFGAIGGNFSYEFIVTSIGDIGTIKCSCGKDEFIFRELQ